MDFKIDTKDNFSVITPIDTPISAIMAESLSAKCAEMRQSGSGNLIIDLQNCTGADKEAVPIWVEMHEESYSNELSLVFTGVNSKMIAILKEDEADLLINITPTMIEAIDIVSMDRLQWDLLREE